MSRLYKVGPNTLHGFLKIANPGGNITPFSSLTNVVLGGGGLGPEELNSPTGREPTLGYWNKHSQWFMDQKRVQNHWSYVKQLQYANASNLSSDRGQYGASIFQLTGDFSYAIKGWNRLNTSLQGAINGNSSRDFHYHLHWADYLWPYIDSDATIRSTFWSRLVPWVNWILTEYGTNVADSDVTIGHHAAIQDLNNWNVQGNPYYHQWDNVISDGPGTPPVSLGGLDATAVDRSTLRNTIKQYYTEIGAGGYFGESISYNENTNLLQLFSYAAMQQLVSGHFPEILTWIHEAIDTKPYLLAPGYRKVCEWGDDEEPHSFTPYEWFNQMCVLQALCTNSASKKRITRLINDFIAIPENFSNLSVSAAGFIGRSFFYWHPYEVQENADWEFKTTPKQRTVTGIGLNLIRCDDQNVMVAQHAPKDLGIQHARTIWCDYTVTVNGKHVLEHPFGYAGTGYGATGGSPGGYWHNGVLLAGIDRMADLGPVAQNNDGVQFTYVASTSNRRFKPENYNRPPPAFVLQAYAIMTYSRDPDTGYDFMLTKDILELLNPITLTEVVNGQTNGFSRYPGTYQTFINNFIAETPNGCLWRRMYHAYSSPAINGNTVSYINKELGSDVAIVTLAPSTYGRLIKVAPTGYPTPPVPNEQLPSLHQIGVYDTVSRQLNIVINVHMGKPGGSVGQRPTCTYYDDNHVQIGNWHYRYNGFVVTRSAS